VLAFLGALTMPVGVCLTSADFEDGEVVASAAAGLAGPAECERSHGGWLCSQFTNTRTAI
jgi:hypothetical protein